MLYTIERDFTGYSEEEINAAAFRALLCISFFPQMDWVRSFYDPATERSRCFYEAASAYDLQNHAETMAIPFSEARPVIEVRPLGPGRVEVGEPVDKADRREAGNTSVWIARLDLAALDPESVVTRFEAISESEGRSWERAFVDREIDEVFAVFRGPRRDDVEERLDRLDLRLRDVREMTEVMPRDITGPGTIDFRPVSGAGAAPLPSRR